MFRGVGDRLAHRLLRHMGIDMFAHLGVVRRLSRIAPLRHHAGDGRVGEAGGDDTDINRGKAERLLEIGISALDLVELVDVPNNLLPHHPNIADDGSVLARIAAD